MYFNSLIYFKSNQLLCSFHSKQKTWENTFSTLEDLTKLKTGSHEILNDSRKKEQ